MQKQNSKLISKPKHKFNAKTVKTDIINFQSKAEARRFEELSLLKKAGDVLFFLMQVPFHLPGKIVYKCDFAVFWKDGNVTFEDVKGFETKEFKIKKKLVEHYFNVEIKIIKC